MVDCTAHSSLRCECAVPNIAASLAYSAFVSLFLRERKSGGAGDAFAQTKENFSFFILYLAAFQLLNLLFGGKTWFFENSLLVLSFFLLTGFCNLAEKQVNMSDYQTNSTVTVNVNGKDAENKLSQLRQRADDLRNAIARAGAEGDKVNQEKFRKELRQTTKEIRLMESSTAEIERVMKNLNRATPRELQRTLTQLNKELKNMERGTSAWDAQTTKIRQVRAELDKVNSSLREHESWFSRINRKLNDWGMTITAALASITGLVLSAKQAVQAYADMDSEMANTRKFTGMTIEQVEALNEEFKKMDTRSSREQLNQMAQDAGRLGKSTKESVMEYVRAADIIGVAMDELGEDAPRVVAQLAAIFNIEQELGTERSMLAVGSAINTLSQNSAAAAPNLVDFASRLGPIAYQTDMLIHEMLAFGAVLDSNRVSVEKSATAIQSVLSKMLADPTDFAKKAGLAVDEFTAAIQRSSTDALLMFVEHLSQLDKLDIAAILANLKVQDSGVIQTFNTLAGKVGDLNNQLEVSATAFAEATSATDEFNVQNNTVQAGLDKAKKKFNELAVQLGEKLMPVMSYAISGSSAVLRLLKLTVDFLYKYKSEVLLTVAAVTAYWAATKSVVAIEKIHNALILAKTKSLKALSGVYLLVESASARLSGNITRANAAWSLFTKLLKSNAVGLAITAVTALTAVIIHLKNKTDALSEAQKRLNEYSSQFQSELAKEQNNIDKLFGSLDAAKKGTENYENAKKEIISQYGEYLEGLGVEIESLSNVAGAYRAITAAAKESARARALASARQSEDDAYYKNLTEQTKVIAEALATGKWTQGRTERSLTTREQQKWLQTILAEVEAGTLSRDTRSFLGHMGVSFTDDGMMRGPAGLVEGISSLMKQRESREYANALINSAFGVPSDFYMGMDIKDMENVIAKLKEIRDLINDTGESKGIGLKNGKTMMFESVADVSDGIMVASKHLKELRQNAGMLPELVVTGNSQLLAPSTSSVSGEAASDDALKKDYERQIAEAKIAYATGLHDYRAYQNNLMVIEAEYIEKRLESNTLELAERKKLEAELAELYKKTLDEQSEFAMTKARGDIEEEHRLRLAALKRQYADGSISDASYREASFREEISYLEQLKDAYRYNAEERAKIEAQIDEKLLTEKLRKKQEHENRLAKIEEQFFGMSQAEKDAAYQQDLNDLNIVYQSQLTAAQNNAEEKLRIEEAYQEALKALRLKYNQESADGAKPEWVSQLADFMESDGFKSFEKGLSVVNSAIGGLFSSYSQLVQAELDIQTAAINERYDKEVEAANGNSTKIAQIEKQREAEIAKAKNDASKKQYSMQVIQAVAQTAQNIIAAVGAGMQFGVAAPYMIALLTGIATATGAVQIAALRKQQQAAAAQGYSTGGFTKPGPVDEPAGIVHAGEWVASQKLLANPTTRSMINALDYAQRTNTIGSIRMSDVHTAMPTLSPISGSHATLTAQENTNKELEKILTMLIVRLNQPFVTVNTVEGDYGIKKAQEEYDKLIKNKSPKR